MNKNYLNVLFCSILIVMTGCASDSVNENSIEDGNVAGTATENLVSFASTQPNTDAKHMPNTRTSMGGHLYLTGADFFWELGDNIYVKDDNATMQNSGTNSNITGTQATACFKLPGKYDGNTYEVYYTGATNTATATNVTITTSQTQTAPILPNTLVFRVTAVLPRQQGLAIISSSCSTTRPHTSASCHASPTPLWGKISI